VDEEIDTLSVANQILGDASVSGQHNGAAAVVHAVAEGQPDRRVIHLERRDL